MTDKNITAWLIVDWKTGKTRTRKSKAKTSELGKNELQGKIDIDVTIPEVDIPTLSLEIDVPEPRVYAATLEAISEEDLPEWSDVAVEAVDAHRDFFDGDDHDFETGIDRATVQTLQEAPGRPDVSNVREFVYRTARDIDDAGVAPVE